MKVLLIVLTALGSLIVPVKVEATSGKLSNCSTYTHSTYAKSICTGQIPSSTFVGLQRLILVCISSYNAVVVKGDNVGKNWYSIARCPTGFKATTSSYIKFI